MVINFDRDDGNCHNGFELAQLCARQALHPCHTCIIMHGSIPELHVYSCNQGAAIG